jgi:glutathione S-transferase
MTRRQPNLTLCELTDPGIEGIESYSPFCLKTHRALRFAGLAYERRFGQAPADFRELNPTSQVPILLVGNEPVADSTRILERIESLTAAFSHGLDAQQRAEAWLWEEFSDTALNGFLVSARWAFDENWPLVREAYFGAAPWFVQRLIAPKLRQKVIGTLVARDVWRQGRDACWMRFSKTLDALDARAPDAGFWVSPAISVADVGLFGQLQSLRTPLTRAHAEQVAKRARLSAYLDRVDAATRERSQSLTRVEHAPESNRVRLRASAA